MRSPLRRRFKGTSFRYHWLLRRVSVSVSAGYTNHGELEGTMNVEIRINGLIAMSQLIALGGSKSRMLLMSSVFTFVVGAVLALLLVPSLQIVGLLIAMIVAPRAGWLYQTIWARRNIGFTVDWGATAKIYVAVFVAFVAAYLVVNVPSLHGWVALVSGGFIYFVVYLVGLPLSGALRHDDFRLLEAIMDSLGPLAPFARYIFSLMNRVVRE